MKLDINVKLTLNFNSQNKQFKVLSCIPIIPNPLFKPTSITHTLTETQIKFGILTLGKTLRQYIPVHHSINIFLNNTILQTENPLKTHKSVNGRINGLTQLYKHYPDVFYANAILNVSFNAKNDQLLLFTTSEVHESSP